MCGKLTYSTFEHVENVAYLLKTRVTASRFESVVCDNFNYCYAMPLMPHSLTFTTLLTLRCEVVEFYRYAKEQRA